VRIHGVGLHGLKAPSQMLDVGNSGTTTRLISGILAGQPFTSSLNGDASIQKRPMKRIMEPLSQMGADIRSLNGNGCAPLEIRPGRLHGIAYQSPVASAQVKSCVLLAGLYAEGMTSVTEPALSRNHTELMLSGFGAAVTSQGTTATIQPEPHLRGQKITVPGDISSAAYWIAAALAVPNSQLVLKNVGINPTRDGMLRVVEAMGAKIRRENIHTVSGELVADLVVTSSQLHGTIVSGELIPTLIDEIPVIAVLACFAKGDTIIKDAAELKVKESNRIDTVVEGLRAMGADAEATADGMVIHGGKALHGAMIDSHLDHRIAMSFAVAGLLCDEPTTIKNADSVAISYPDFYESLQAISV
jgi:3-phosphoshikimate 1-carboxyvinyltransferase